MKQAELIAQVKQEIARVPRGQPGSPQNEYRMIFWESRMNSLGPSPAVGPSLKEAHAYALNAVRERHPTFTPTLLN